MKRIITLKVNGEEHDVLVKDNKTLLDVFEGRFRVHRHKTWL